MPRIAYVPMISMAILGRLGGPPEVASGSAAVWGRLALVPREGIDARAPAASPYADRRLRDVPVFASPGPFSQVSSSGRYVLPGLVPGRVALHAWHPRFPPVHTTVELREGVATRMDLGMDLGMDLEMGVSRGLEAEHADAEH